MNPQTVAILTEPALVQRLALIGCDLLLQAEPPFVVFDSVSDWQNSPVPYLLCWREDAIVLLPKNARLQPLSVDFLSGSVGFRGQQNVRNEMVVKAVLGREKQYLPSVLDATAGLGKDSFILAMLGCKVTLVERNPVVQVLLADGLYRYRQVDDQDHLLVAERMALYLGDFAAIGESLPRCEVVYLDPMFPARDKSALVKKEMRIFKDIVGADEDSGELLDLAMGLALQKVVVKRSGKADFLAGLQPTYSITGKSSRFDVYQC